MGKKDSLRSDIGGNAKESWGGDAPLPVSAGSPPAGPPPPPDETLGTSRLRNVKAIEVARITRDPDQPRKEFDEPELAELVESLKARGQLQPIRVRYSRELAKYVVISGERRLRAADRLGLATLMCVVEERDMTAEEILIDQYEENAKRADLKPIEQAQTYRKLMDAKGWTQVQLAERLNVAQSRISESLSLLRLDDAVIAKVEDGTIAPESAIQLAKVEDPAEQKEIAARIESANMTRDEVAEEVKQARSLKKPKSAGAKKSPSKKSKPAKVTTRVFNRSGIKLMAERGRGLDPAELLDILEFATEQVRSELAESA